MDFALTGDNLHLAQQLFSRQSEKGRNAVILQNREAEATTPEEYLWDSFYSCKNAASRFLSVRGAALPIIWQVFPQGADNLLRSE